MIVRVIVTGADGRLGRSIAREFEQAGHDVEAFGRRDLDVTDPADVQRVFDGIDAGALINCAAYNAVDAAEQDVEQAFRTNAFAVRVMADLAQSRGSIFVHYGSDFVFDGRSLRPYTELDRPNPLSVYGLSKLVGERLAARCARHYVLRLSSLFGGESARQSTVDWMIASIQGGRAIQACSDRVVSPSYAPTVARATRLLIERGAAPGLYHAGSSAWCTWQQLAEEIARQLGVAARITPVMAAAMPLAAARPRFCALASDKLAVAAGFAAPVWQEALATHMERACLT